MLVFILIINHLCLYSQVVKVYQGFKKTTEFDSIAYLNSTILINVELLNAKGEKINVAKGSLQVKGEKDEVFSQGSESSFGFHPYKSPDTYLNIFWQGRLLQKMKVKVLNSPIPSVYLVNDLTTKQALDLNQPISADKDMEIVVNYPPILQDKTTQVFYVRQVTIWHQRSGRFINQKKQTTGKINLKEFNPRSGDRFFLEIQSKGRHLFDCKSFINNHTLSFQTR
jgi:hypothetical protein